MCNCASFRSLGLAKQACSLRANFHGAHQTPRDKAWFWLHGYVFRKIFSPSPLLNRKLAKWEALWPHPESWFEDKVGVHYLDTFISEPTSCRIWNTQLVRDWLANPNCARRQLSHIFRSSWEYLNHYHCRFLCSVSGYVGLHNHVDYWY